MKTTLEQQTTAIRMAIKSLEHDIVKMTQKGTAANDETILEMRAEQRAMNDAIEALRAAEAFKASVKSFLG